MMRFTTLGRLLVYLTATAMAAGLQLAWADGTWQQGSGLSGLSGAASGSVAGDAAGNLYVATDVGIYKSSDAGASWSAAFDGLSGDATRVRKVVAGPDGTLFALTRYGGGIFRSVDGGANWVVADVGLSREDLAQSSPNIVFASDGTMYLGSRGLYRSRDGGQSWQAVDSSRNLTNLLLIDSAGTLYAHVYRDTYEYQGLQKSSDGGKTWVAASSGLDRTDVSQMTQDLAGNLFAGTVMGIFRSQDQGSSWTAVNTGLRDTTSPYPYISISGLVVDSNGTVYASTYNRGVFRTSDAGATWMTVGNGLDGDSLVVFSLLADTRGNLFAYTKAGNFKLARDSKNWVKSNMGLGNIVAEKLAVDGRAVYMAGPAGLFKSTDGGGGWRQVGSSSTVITDSLLAAGGVLYFGVSQSLDGSASWSTRGGLGAYRITALADDGRGSTYASAVGWWDGFWGEGVYMLRSGSGAWKPVNSGLGEFSLPNYANPIFSVLAFDRQGSLYAAGSRLFKRASGTEQWKALDSSPFKFVSSMVFDRAGAIFAGDTKIGVFKSRDGGLSWTAMNHGLEGNALSIQALALDSRGRLYAGTWGAGVWQSVDGGASWTALNRGLRGLALNVHALAVDGDDTLYVGGEGGVFQLKSTAPASTWSAKLTPSGALTSQTLNLDFAPLAIDNGRAGCVFVGAAVQDQLFLLGSKGWQPYAGDNPTPFRSGPLGATQATLVNQLNLTGLAGTPVYAGYGQGDSPADCLTDMLQSRSYRQLFTVQ